MISAHMQLEVHRRGSCWRRRSAVVRRVGDIRTHLPAWDARIVRNMIVKNFVRLHLSLLASFPIENVRGAFKRAFSSDNSTCLPPVYRMACGKDGKLIH
jgi:hypothetical protein